MSSFIVCHTHTGELAGSTQVVFRCPSNGSSISIQQWDMYPSNHSGVQLDIARDTIKYHTSTDRLEIRNLEATDEGAYICTFTVDGGSPRQALGGCLVIYGE